MSISGRPKEKRRRQSGKGTELEDIREVALTLFAERGYRGTGIRDIAEALEIGSTTVYNNITSKQDLLRDIVLETCSALLEIQADAIASTDDVVEQLRRIAEGHVHYAAGRQREALITTEDFDAVEEPWLTEVMALRQQYQHRVQEIVEAGKTAGVFDVDLPKLASFAIIEMCESVARWFRDTGPLSQSRVAYAYGDFAVRIAGYKGK